jgi:acetolactate synthase-1/2/3 large subunit
MNGAESLVRTLVAGGVDVCFTNPGTSEMHFVAALDKVDGMRCVLCLFEGVATGAADGYARMADKPASTLLHLGPGLANGIANLHNARRARSAVLNLVGDHATWHLPFDAPLASDIKSLAMPVSGHYAYLASPQLCISEILKAVQASKAGMIGTVVIPTDVQEHVFGEQPEIPALPVRKAAAGHGTRIEAAARALRDCRNTIILLGAKAMTSAGQKAAAAIAAATGARVFAETFPARWDRGGDIPVIPRFPYFPEMGLETLKGAECVLLAGARAPIAYFGKTGLPSELLRPGTRVETLAEPEGDAEDAIVALALALGAGPCPPCSLPVPSRPEPGLRLNASVMAETVAALLPEQAIVAVEGATTTPVFFTAAAAANPHTVLTNTGGAIGQGMPVATGAALACPDRQVINLQGDGSAAYTMQALWTQAREKLNVVTVLCANRTYGVLRVELERAGMDPDAPVPYRMTSLEDPALDWVGLSRGFGVPAARAHTAGDLSSLIRTALLQGGPFLIEAVMA